MKKLLSIVLIFIMLMTYLTPVSASNTPSRNEEVIYGLLDLDGSVKNIYVVNIFDGGEITDYGDYSELRNLTSSEKIDNIGGEITVSTNAEKFYYQGTLAKKELPWNISIRFFLNGKELPGKDLAGKSGELKILVSIKQNNNVNSFFFDNYALQISLSLDTRLCSGIKAENATIALAGNKKQLTYTVLPGKGADIAVLADVRDFEMEPISISAIKLNINLDIDAGDFSTELSKLTDAIRELDSGASELLDGISQLSDGMEKYINGMKAFKDGLEQIPGGADDLFEGASSIKNGLSELAKQNESIMKGALAIQQATFDTVNAQLAGMGVGLPVLTPENYNSILSGIPSLAAVKEQLDGTVRFTQGLESYLKGVSQLDKGTSGLLAGISEFKTSSSVLAASANELYNAGAELNNAVKKLKDGLASYKAGTNELKKGTSDMDLEIERKINEMLEGITGNDDKTVSFVSDKNTNVSAVQFVLKTDAIDITENGETAEVEAEPVKLSFWQRLLELFRMLIKR